ncbi:GntR family transcriptional regulator [Nonomuraea zeae]|uniref:GntR family transcriptional regulator n=1 Tax=Nonomuraea zeae TaxID=1642303 RepID=A0A5S4FLH1_9ACTN|nr:GntR family transcriptional regulator [Nonomuraea zeae]TMR21061.1 GntR family transcriptional regulator [Nonomuraea zeae]
MPTFPQGKPRPHLVGSQGGEPKYQAIYRDLLAQIDSGEFAPGRPLPSQRELGAYYGVSLMTVRQALQRLSAEGRIEQRHGLGTFVAGAVIPYQMNSLGSLADDLAEQGIELETVLLGVRRAQPPGPVRAELGLAARADVTVVERLRIVNGSPVIHQLSYVPRSLTPKPAKPAKSPGAPGSRRATPFLESLEGGELERTPLYTLIEERCGISLAWATEAVKPVVLSEEQAGLLSQPAGSAALLSTRVTFDADDRPVLVDRALMCASQIVFTTRRQAPQPAVTLRLDA